MSDFDKYSKEFTSKALQNGYSQENIDKCLKYSKVLLDKNLPIIYNEYHFGSLVGYKSKYIKKASFGTPFFYRYFAIKKKNGNIRTIAEPLPSLKEIQDWILNEILYKIKVSRYAKGFVPKKGLKDHLRYHKTEKQILTLDIEDFFGSIKFDSIFKMFKSFGYSNDISKILTQLCTLEYKLPQGAPTSPYITNIILIPFDDKISSYCKENNLKYTRYADDLAFSGEFDSIKLISFVKQQLKELDLKLNKDKTLLMKRNVQQIVSGVVLNDKIQVPKASRNKIRNEMFYIKKYGLENHLSQINEYRENYLLHLIGKINYLLSLNPKDDEFINYKKYLYSIKEATNYI